MDLTSFKPDIDELIDEFTKVKLPFSFHLFLSVVVFFNGLSANCCMEFVSGLCSLLFVVAESTSLADMKMIWLSQYFSYIYEVRPSTKLAFFMQSLYTNFSFSHRVGGLCCLLCLYETQPCKPPLKIYLSLEELKKLRELVIDAKENNIKVVSSLVRKMLEANIFLFGFVDANEDSFVEKVNQLTQLQNARLQVAYEELFANTKIEDFLHMDLASKVVDVGDIKHIAEDKELVGDVAEKMVGQWDSQREFFINKQG
ncbi:hypothetical protein DVH24_042800 [Malus domestica]|uniref:Uncharacterized protein n=1 Tax=Malus domestica TaxID=3750 RepID=A0A498I4I3_MALDO|nr:hypothetical protein DVH24_042800 [Malus domestica]